MSTGRRMRALFLKFEYVDANDEWVVTDKSGTRHYFGSDANCRQEGPNQETFRWNISKVVDTKGNAMTVSHTSDSGHVYLERVEYNGNEAQGFSATHKVEFTLEDRPDPYFSYLSGVKDEVRKRLKRIEVKVKDGGGVWELGEEIQLELCTVDSDESQSFDKCRGMRDGWG